MNTHTRIRTTKADKLASPEAVRFMQRENSSSAQKRIVKKSHHKKQRSWDKKLAREEL